MMTTQAERDKAWIEAAGPELVSVRRQFLDCLNGMASTFPRKDRWRVVGAMMETAIKEAEDIPECHEAFAEALYTAADGFACTLKRNGLHHG